MPQPTSESVPTTSTSASPSALDAVREEALAIPVPELVPVRVDITAATIVALGAAPEVRVHREALRAAFGEEAVRSVDRLEAVARAAAQAHAEYAALGSPVDLEPLVRDVIDARTMLLTDAESLATRKLIGRKEIEQLAGGQAYLDRYHDVLQLLGVFRAHWAAIESQTPLTLADLDRAQAAVDRFSAALGLRSQADVGTTPPERLRAGVYTLFFRTYDEVRRMVAHLRWHEGDADRIAPSLFAGRSAPKRERAAADAPVAPTGPTPAPGMPGSSPFVTA